LNYQTSYDKLVKDYKKLIDRIERAEQEKKARDLQEELLKAYVLEKILKHAEEVKTLKDEKTKALNAK
jgi:hypothetical protein